MTKTSNALGAQGEDLAARTLQRQGYQILARNYRGNGCEIDIIAGKGGITYFVEVKSRGQEDFFRPGLHVTPRKRSQIAKAAAHWFATQGQETASALLVAEVYPQSGQVYLFEDFLC